MNSPNIPMTTRARADAILRVTSGNFLEQFDFFLFGFYATYIAHTFFPASSEFASLMMTFAVFGAGFLMRPIGAVVLGAYIDKVGRRKGLIVTLSIMAAGTFLIVLIPSYQTIGLWAPLLVLGGAYCKVSRQEQSWVAYPCIWLRLPLRAVKAFIPVGSPAASKWPLWWPRRWASR